MLVGVGIQRTGHFVSCGDGNKLLDLEPLLMSLSPGIPVRGIRSAQAG